jgi:HIV Tat-specific factor 1
MSSRTALHSVADADQVMHGRWFDERQLEAYVADGSEKFKRSNEKMVDVAEGEEEADGERLDKFGSWLEEIA